MRFLEEFKKFALRGNVIDLAVGVVIGVAFNNIVKALVDGIIMPLIGLLLGGINIADKTFVLGDAVVKWGAFLQSVIDFTLVAFSIFIVIKAINRLKHPKEEPAAAPVVTEEVLLLRQIRDQLKKK